MIAAAILSAIGCEAALAQVPAEAVATVAVDARTAPRGIMSAHLELPVAAGPLTLVYPKWLPGRHSPAGPLTSLAGLLPTRPAPRPAAASWH